jgi:hypothetical protein
VVLSVIAGVGGAVLAGTLIRSWVVNQAISQAIGVNPLIWPQPLPWYTDPVSAGLFTGVVTLVVLFMAEVLDSIGR